MKSLSYRLHYVFRIACAMCFIGHGAFGIITKQVWCNYFGVFGINEVLAYQLMPVVGTIDIIMGIILIVYPVRAVAAWLVFWGLFTASLRPLSGEPFAEFLERAGNYGAPLLLLIISGPLLVTPGAWFEKVKPSSSINEESMNLALLCLRIIACLLLVGHGWLNIIEKGGLIKQYASVGMGNPFLTAHIIGAIEIASAFVILFIPVRQIVFILFLWKMISELLYPSHELFEWVERGGSYGVLLGLWLLLRFKSSGEQATLTGLHATKMNDSSGTTTTLSIVRNRLAIFSILGMLVFISCDKKKNELTQEEVKRLLYEGKAYPKAVGHRIFCNDTETAKKISESDLVQQKLMTAQLLHTSEDVGKPLVHFTESATPYLLPTSDTLKSIDVQIVKIADEHFSEVSNIVRSTDGTQARVEYTIKIEGITPFAVLLNSGIDKKQHRETFFTLTKEGWKWNKKISQPYKGSGASNRAKTN